MDEQIEACLIIMAKSAGNSKLKTKKEKSRAITTFDELLNSQYVERGTQKRIEFAIKANAFGIGEIIKEERRLAFVTQQQRAEKTGKKSFISRMENGDNDIQLSTLYRLLEFGLGRKVSITFQ